MDDCYRGEFSEGDVRVMRPDGVVLDLYLDEVCHSPTGFAWGYHGSGPAQLAYALLRDTLGDTKGRRIALDYYQEFKRDVVAPLDQRSGWSISKALIFDWLAARNALLEAS